MTKKESKNDGGGDYEVGFCKPPKHSRFRPGQSGNRKGRPKGTRNFRTDVKETLKSPVSVTSGGKQRKISTQEATLLRLKEKALKGDTRAINLLIHLAQSHNNEDVVSAVTSLSADDAMVLETYQDRVLSGAAEKIKSATENEGRDHADTSAAPETLGLDADVKGKRTNRPRRARSKETAPSKGKSDDGGDSL